MGTRARSDTRRLGSAQRPHIVLDVVGGQETVLADFSSLHHPYLEPVSQWDFLDFLREEAETDASFRPVEAASSPDIPQAVQHCSGAWERADG